MARINKGILGGFSGTVGNVVGGNWRGIDYMRSKPTIRKSRVATAAQTVQKARFSLAAKFLGAMKDVMNIMYLDYGGKMTGANSALRQVLNSAVHGEYPNLNIDYSQVNISRGTLATPQAAPVIAGAPGALRFQWTDNTGFGSAKATDKVVLVAYCPELNECVYTIGPALRPAANAELSLQRFAGKQVQTWIAFITADGRNTSSSVFTGAITVV